MRLPYSAMKQKIAGPMTVRRSRLAFWVGLFLYLISFCLTAVRGDSFSAAGSPSIASWTFEEFLFPLIYVHRNSVGSFLEELNFANVSFLLNAWINPLFLLTMFFVLVERASRLVNILRYMTLLLIPFCWVTLLYQRAYPREGYVLWTLGMVLVLLANDLDKRARFDPNA